MTSIHSPTDQKIKKFYAKSFPVWGEVRTFAVEMTDDAFAEVPRA